MMTNFYSQNDVNEYVEKIKSILPGALPYRITTSFL